VQRRIHARNGATAAALLRQTTEVPEAVEAKQVG
jgi:hypothetical protein